MTNTEKREIIEAAALIGAHATEFPSPSANEKLLLHSIQLLCMAVIKLADVDGLN